MTDKTIRESADKYRAETTVTRGNGTRDQEKIKLKSRGDDPAETVDGLFEMIAQVQDTELDETLRQMQPEEEK